MSFRYPPDSVADAERHLIRLRRSKIGKPEGFQILVVVEKLNGIQTFFLQSLMPLLPNTGSLAWKAG